MEHRRQTKCAVLLAGGRSVRFGSDKLLASLRGEPVIAHAVRAALSLFEEVILVGKQPEKYRPALARARLLEGSGLSLLRDRSQQETPLAGVEAGLLSARAGAAFVCAADMPFAADASLIAALEAVLPGHDAAAPRFRGEAEPLCAIYLREPCAAAASALLKGAPAGPREMLLRVRSAWIDYESIAPDDPDGRPFLDADTPDALSLLERHLR